MSVRSISEYKTQNAWTLFKKMFKVNEKLFISSSFRNNDSSIDWVHCFDAESKFIGDMNLKYFYDLKKGGYIIELT